MSYSLIFSLLLLLRYAETVGLEGTFRSRTLSKGEDDFQHEIRLTGNLYKEVENAEVILTTDAEDRPNDFKFKVLHCITLHYKTLHCIA